MLNDEFEAELARVRQALVNSIAVEKQIEMQLKKNNDESKNWESRAAMARSSNQEKLALEADEKVKQCNSKENELKIELMSQRDFSANLKRDLSKLEARRFTADSSGADALKAADSTMSTIQRMENKILSHESLAELNAPDQVELKFAKDKANDDIEEELRKLKESQKKD